MSFKCRNRDRYIFLYTSHHWSIVYIDIFIPHLLLISGSVMWMKHLPSLYHMICGIKQHCEDELWSGCYFFSRCYFFYSFRTTIFKVLTVCIYTTFRLCRYILYNALEYHLLERFWVYLNTPRLLIYALGNWAIFDSGSEQPCVRHQAVKSFQV